MIINCFACYNPIYTIYNLLGSLRAFEICISTEMHKVMHEECTIGHEVIQILFKPITFFWVDPKKIALHSLIICLNSSLYRFFLKFVDTYSLNSMNIFTQFDKYICDIPLRKKVNRTNDISERPELFRALLMYMWHFFRNVWLRKTYV